MRMKIIVLVLTSFITTSYGKDCEFSHNNKKSTVKWTAYKTLKKIGVSGTFSEIKFSAKKSNSVKNLLQSASFHIKTESVESKNAARDVKIAKFFFSTMNGGPFITGKVTKVEKDKVIIALTMNGVTKVIRANYQLNNQQLFIKSQIDVLDFAMRSEHKALGRACESKHEGKTWTTVDLEAIISLKKSCS